jgi:hypothetical protein
MNNLNALPSIVFPTFRGIRCLMMPFIQGDPESVPEQYRKGYEDILATTFLKNGDIGFLTIDESPATIGQPHRGHRAQFNRALHTEVGIRPNKIYAWGSGNNHFVELDADVKILLANNIDDSCALWDATHHNTTVDGDIGHFSDQYPISKAILMKSGEVHEIGILTPHESLPVKENANRQFLRILSAGVYGREPYFTENPLIKH